MILFQREVGSGHPASSTKPASAVKPAGAAKPASTAKPVRVGIVIPGKQGKAVVRNRAKRQIREVFQKNLDKLPGDCDITFICWDVKFDYSKIEKDITILICKL